MTENSKINRLFLPSLMLSYFVIELPRLLISLLLIDIASTFSTSVGSMSQINTIGSTVAIIFAFLTAALSVKFRHKSLLLIGLLILIISALGCALALNFIFILLAYSLTGIALALTAPMGITLIGEYFPLEKRATAIGWINAGSSLSYLIGAPVIALMAGIKDWRLVLFAFILPISIMSFYLAFVSIPSRSQTERPSNSLTERHLISKKSYLAGFKEVLQNKSASFCLLGSVFRTAYFIAILLYVPSFVRQKFLLSTNYASIILLVGASLYTLGSLASAWFVNRFGRKSSTVLTLFLSGIFIILYPYFSSLWLSLFFMFLACWFSGMAITAAVSLTLEQVPRYAGTMMSLNAVAVNIGSAVGSGIGGLALISFGYKGLGNILGSLGVLGAFIYYFLTKDILPASEPI